MAPGKQVFLAYPPGLEPKKKRNKKKKNKQQQAAAPRKQRRKQGGGKQRAKGSRGMMKHRHLMSPLHPGLVPSALFQGKAFPYGGLDTHELPTGTSSRHAIIVTNTGISGTIGAVLTWPATGGVGTLTPAQINMLTIPTLQFDDTTGGPTSMRAMKASVDLVNRTSFLNRGGPISSLNLTQRMLLPAAPSAMTYDQWNTWYTDLLAFNKNHPLDLADFGKPRHMYCQIVDDPRYNDYDENTGVKTLDEFFRHVSVWLGATGTDDRPMSTLIYLIGQQTQSQALYITARGTFYTRWPVTTVPGQAQRNVPVAPPGFHNVVARHAAEVADAAPEWTGRLESVIRAAATVNNIWGTARDIFEL